MSATSAAELTFASTRDFPEFVKSAWPEMDHELRIQETRTFSGEVDVDSRQECASNASENLRFDSIRTGTFGLTLTAP